MTNKKFWLGMLVLVLVFGMTVVGCLQEEPEQEEEPFFDCTIRVYDIPSNLNGENFTLSVIKDSEVKASKDGIVTGGQAKANLVFDNFGTFVAIKNERGDDCYPAYIAIKIGNNPQIITEKQYLFSMYRGEDGNLHTGVSMYLYYRATYLSEYSWE